MYVKSHTTVTTFELKCKKLLKKVPPCYKNWCFYYTHFHIGNRLLVISSNFEKLNRLVLLKHIEQFLIASHFYQAIISLKYSNMLLEHNY